MLYAMKILGGAAVGGVVGWLIGGGRVCSTGACRATGSRWLSAAGGAVLGAALAWYGLQG